MSSEEGANWERQAEIRPFNEAEEKPPGANDPTDLELNSMEADFFSNPQMQSLVVVVSDDSEMQFSRVDDPSVNNPKVDKLDTERC